MIRLRSVLVPAALVLGAGTAVAGGELTDQQVRELFVAMTSGEECTPAPEHQCDTACEEGWKASEKLTGYLVKKPAGWEVVEPLFYQKYKANEAQRGQLLGFLASVGTEGCLASAEKLYGKTPEAFTDLHVVAFAERASDAFAAIASKRVKKNKCETILPAAYLAIHGDDAGKKTLRKAVEVEQLDESNVFEALVAAAALDRIGDGKKPALPHTQQRVADAVFAALDAGDLDRAKGLALRAEAVHEAFAGGTSAYGKGKKKVSLSYLDSQLGWHVKKRSEQIASADDVFALIERITPVS